MFPSTIASNFDGNGQPVAGGPYGTGSCFDNYASNPTGWSPFIDEDELWIKTWCEAKEGAENPVEPVEEYEVAWGVDLTPSGEPWWSGEGYENWTEEVPDYEQEGQSYWPAFETHCPCAIWIKWLGTDGQSGTVSMACPKKWFRVMHVAANVHPGEQVDITVRMICGDCVVQTSDTATMAQVP